MKNIKLIALVVVFTLSLLVTSCKTQSYPPQDGSFERNESRQGGGRQGGPEGGGERPSAEQLISAMDANKDGKLSKDEVKGPLANDFSRVDTNNDGFLSLQEIEEGAPKNQSGRQGPPRN